MFGCSSYQTLLKHQSHSVSVKHESSSIVAHIQVEKPKNHFKEKLFYYGFKGGEIFKTQGSLNGTALHGDYKECYETKELKEQGKFVHGLKHDTWKTWYINGNLKSASHYRHGKQCGKQLEYDINGQLAKKTKYFLGKQLGLKKAEYKQKRTTKKEEKSVEVAAEQGENKGEIKKKLNLKIWKKNENLVSKTANEPRKKRFNFGFSQKMKPKKE
jgi:hypothetical protein